MTVITAVHRGEGFATTASALTSLSVEPPMLLVCLNLASDTRSAVAGSGRFAVNILAEEQEHLARRFATKGRAKFDAELAPVSASGLPLVRGALAWLECRVVDTARGGTHVVFIAEVEQAGAREGRPLTHYRGQYGRLVPAADTGRSMPA